MHTPKLTLLCLLFGILIMLSILAVPVQAQTMPSGGEHLNSEYSQKPATKTKRAKTTSTPRKTATPKPANTATRTTSNQNTSVAVSSTPESQSTKIGTTGTPLSTSVVPSTSVTSVSGFTPTSTVLAVNTMVAQQTKTAGASFLTSTSLALTFSPTPTNFGAATSTLNSWELTATAFASSTPQLWHVSQVTQVASLRPSATTGAQIPVSIKQPPVTQKRPQIYWIAGIGGAILLGLVYMLYSEWKRYPIKKW